MTVAYFTASKWAIHHEMLTFYDASCGNRPVAVDIAIRRDKELQANAGMIKLPVAILNHGNTVRFTQYSFLANVVKKVVTLDNLRVPFITDGGFKILSFRSKDPGFKTGPGVIPSEEQSEKAGITIVRTGFRHNDMRDDGSEDAKASIAGTLDSFLDDQSPLKPGITNAPSSMIDAPPVSLLSLASGRQMQANPAIAAYRTTR
jgi:hypothetical protein